MTQLLDTFVDTFLAEQGRYKWWGEFDERDFYTLTLRHSEDPEGHPLHTGTRAECTRWIAEQAARKAFRAMRGSMTEFQNCMFAGHFIHDLAAEPETTSGDVE